MDTTTIPKSKKSHLMKFNEVTPERNENDKEHKIQIEKYIENKLTFPCCENNPVFHVTYSVAGEQKTYSVCRSCSELEYFRKYIVEKKEFDSIKNSIKKDQEPYSNGII